MPFYLSLPAGDPGVALGVSQNRRWPSAHSDPARLADRLTWRPRNGGTRWRRTRTVLLGRSDSALQRTSPNDSLSLHGAGVDAGAAAGTPRHHRQRSVPHGHRPARRSRLTEPLRRLLWDGRLPDWRSTP